MRNHFRFWLAALLVAFLAIGVAACATSHNPYADANRPATYGRHARVADSMRRELASLPAPYAQAFAGRTGFFLTTPEGQARRQARRDVKATSQAAARVAQAAVPRKVKVVDGAFAWGDNATASATGKKSGPNVVGDSSTLNAVTGGGNLAATTGDGNSTVLTKQDTSKEAPDWKAALAGPVAKVAALLVAGLAIYLIYLLWGFLPRRKSTTDSRTV